VPGKARGPLGKTKGVVSEIEKRGWRADQGQITVQTVKDTPPVKRACPPQEKKGPRETRKGDARGGKIAQEKGICHGLPLEVGLGGGGRNRGPHQR